MQKSLLQLSCSCWHCTRVSNWHFSLPIWHFLIAVCSEDYRLAFFQVKLALKFGNWLFKTGTFPGCHIMQGILGHFPYFRNYFWFRISTYISLSILDFETTSLLFHNPCLWSWTLLTGIFTVYILFSLSSVCQLTLQFWPHMMTFCTQFPIMKSNFDQLRKLVFFHTSWH